jgi:hypothetical protein
MPEAPAAVRGPATLRWAVGLLAAQAAGLAVVTVLLVYADVVATTTTVQGAIGLTIFAALMAALIGLFAWSLHRRRRWARGPAIVLQLLLVPIGWTMVGGGQPALGVPVIALGLIGAATLLAPATREALDASDGA